VLALRMWKRLLLGRRRTHHSSGMLKRKTTEKLSQGGMRVFSLLILSMMHAFLRPSNLDRSRYREELLSLPMISFPSLAQALNDIGSIMRCRTLHRS